MLSFTPTDEQQMLIDAIEKYALNDMRKAARDADEFSRLPVDAVRKGWEIGLLPVSIPEEYGGLGEYSAVTNVLAAEAFGYGDLPVALAVMAPGLVAMPVLLSGTAEQKQNILPQMLDTAPAPFTAALLEPGLSFNANAPKTTAAHDGDHYILNGSKCYVPLAADACLMAVYARDTETGKVDGYLVDAGTDGLKVCEREKLMGIR